MPSSTKKSAPEVQPNVVVMVMSRSRLVVLASCARYRDRRLLEGVLSEARRGEVSIRMLLSIAKKGGRSVSAPHTSRISELLAREFVPSRQENNNRAVHKQTSENDR